MGTVIDGDFGQQSRGMKSKLIQGGCLKIDVVWTSQTNRRDKNRKRRGREKRSCFSRDCGGNGRLYSRGERRRRGEREPISDAPPAKRRQPAAQHTITSPSHRPLPIVFLPGPPACSQIPSLHALPPNQDTAETLFLDSDQLSPQWQPKESVTDSQMGQSGPVAWPSWTDVESSMVWDVIHRQLIESKHSPRSQSLLFC
ncbi:hypothetical protein BDW62DRAFT_104484 [Aspergillus aurantiobrunneus]